MKNSTRPLSRALTLSAFVAVTGLHALYADTLLWDGGAGDGLLSSANNWDLNQAPAGGDILNISDGSSVSHENTLPPGSMINLTGNSTLQPVSAVLRLNGATLNIGSGSTLTGGSFGFDLGGGNLTFNDGAIATMTTWEQKGANTIRFNLGTTGFTPLTPGALRLATAPATTWSDATYVVDFDQFSGGTGTYNLTLLDFGGDFSNSTNTDFQNATFAFENTGSTITSPSLTWSDAQDSVTLSFTAIPEPTALAFLCIGITVLAAARGRMTRP